MKRFWMFLLYLAAGMAVLIAPPSAQADEATDQDSLGTLREDMNSALGTHASRLSDIEKTLGLKFFGDVRVRFDWRTQVQSDPELLNTAGTALTSGGPIQDITRGRFRARLGAMKTDGDITGGLRISTGAATNPNSENQTFDAGFVDASLFIDQAYLTYMPSALDKFVKITAGKMPNPLTVSPITWDPDIVPEGVLLELNNANTNTKLRATYFDVSNQNGGGAQAINTVNNNNGVTNVTLYVAGSDTDEYMANFQLEQLLKFDTDTSSTLMLGYEYIPNVTALAGGNVMAPPNGALALNNALVGADGMIWDFGGSVPNIQMLEGMIKINHVVGGIPLAWTFHGIDNLDSFYVPKGENQTLSKMPLKGQYQDGTTQGGVVLPKLSNQFGFYGQLNINAVKAKGDLAGFVAVGYLEPNAQLGFLTDDDPGNNNREYLKANITYGLENNVQLMVTSWAVCHVYDQNYVWLGAPNDKLGGTSINPEYLTYVDLLMSF